MLAVLGLSAIVLLVVLFIVLRSVVRPVPQHPGVVTDLHAAFLEHPVVLTASRVSLGWHDYMFGNDYLNVQYSMFLRDDRVMEALYLQGMSGHSTLKAMFRGDILDTVRHGDDVITGELSRDERQALTSMLYQVRGMIESKSADDRI